MKILMKNIISAIEELLQVLKSTTLCLPRQQLVPVRINDGRQPLASKRGARKPY
jgi:hypothetical protein